MRNFEQFNISMKEENIYVDDTIVIEDEFSASEDSHDREFYQQLVSESLSNDVEDCEATDYDLSEYRKSDVKEYIESEDSADLEFNLQFGNESLSDDAQGCDPKYRNSDSEDELDVGSVADNSLTVLSTSPVPGGIKTRLRVRRPARDTRSNSSSSDNSSQRSKAKTKSKHHKDSRGKNVREVFYWTANEEVRNDHNVKERQRRGDLRHGLDELRVLVPAVAGDKRASKVVILSHATTYCRHIRAEFQARQKLVLELCQHQKRLRHRLDKLRKAAMT